VFEISILPSAQVDLESGYWFYEAQAERLGTYFLDSLTSDIESLHMFAGIHPKPVGGFHRTLSKRFPFAIYYDLSGSTALIVAVLDCRQDPASIRERLGGQKPR
jgi:plasmid stabilization system protein ParE